MKLKFLRLFGCASVTFLFSGCYVFSAFQNARMLRPNEVSLTPSFSNVSYQNDGNSDAMTDNFGAQLGFGLSKTANLFTRYERLNYSDKSGRGYNYFDVGPKFALIRNELAFGMPIGFFFGEDVDENNSLQMAPSLFWTIPANRILDVNLSSKYLIFFDKNADNLVALNAGLGVNFNRNRISLLPEIGVLVNPARPGDGRFFQWGLGACFKL